MQVAAIDFAEEMLQYASERESLHSKCKAAKIDWILGDAMKLPFEASSFDAATMGYGLRNVSTSEHLVLVYYCQSSTPCF